MTSQCQNQIHELKIWCEYFTDVRTGLKSFELRKNDRDFKVNDQLLLREWDNKGKGYTGQSVLVDVTYILKNASAFGLKEGYCIMGIQRIPRSEQGNFSNRK